MHYDAVTACFGHLFRAKIITELIKKLDLNKYQTFTEVKVVVASGATDQSIILMFPKNLRAACEAKM